MFLIDFFLALGIAALVTALFTVGFRRRGPWGSWPIFFLLIFLGAWAGGVWLGHAGRPVWGIYWAPFVIVALLFAMLMAAVTPPSRPSQSPLEAWERARQEVETVLIVETFFWLLLVSLVAIIFLHYVA